MVNYQYQLIDGDDEYLVDTTDELKDLIDDIATYAQPDEQVILTVHLIAIEDES